MKNIGVISNFRLPVASTYLKTYAFFFDEFLVAGGSRPSPLSWRQERSSSTEDLDELNYLYESGILKNGTIEPGNLKTLPAELAKSYQQQTVEFYNALQKGDSGSFKSKRMFQLRQKIDEAQTQGLNADQLIKEHNALVTDVASELVESTRVFEEAARLLALDQRVFHGQNAVSLENLGFSTAVDRQAGRNELVQIVVNGIAIPEERIPWNDIIQFREDADSQKRLRDLHLWVSELANGNVSYGDAVNRIESLKDQYRTSIKAAGMKYSMGIVQTIVVGFAGLIEKTFKLKFEELAKAPFELINGGAEYLEAERNAPGRQLSYAVRVENRFH